VTHAGSKYIAKKLYYWEKYENLHRCSLGSILKILMRIMAMIKDKPRK
jgi:hypothetical protein